MSNSVQIIDFITEELLDEDDIVIKKETSLFQDRVLDSLNLLSLIAFLEKKFDIKIASSEINYENLDSVANILKFLECKKN
ncbi:acyl carrier protein [Candidatus Pacearchaeota archaeon]|nr:acyl carrier protein [Candidatus Pacearchaeota archaeon]